MRLLGTFIVLPATVMAAALICWLQLHLGTDTRLRVHVRTPRDRRGPGTSP